MPIHDWMRVEEGIFHSFYLSWIGSFGSSLNSGLLPANYYALAEQIPIGLEPDAPEYAWWTVAVRHVSDHRRIAFVEIVSPHKKINRRGLRPLLDKAATTLSQGIHLLLVDMPLPEPRGVRGIHEELWGEIGGDSMDPPKKPFTLIAYAAGPRVEAYAEQLVIGDPLPDMPLFLTADQYVNVPLETTYHAAYQGMPRYYRAILERRSEP